MEQVVLHRGAVSASLWDVLSKLMAEPRLSKFILVGGTALALQLGHRSSEDIDLFCQNNFNEQTLAIWLENNYPVERIYTESNTISAYISGVKTDLMTHAYPLIDEISCMEGIRFASLKDIAAMKLNAISGRGLRKDFWDLAALMDIFSLQEMLSYFRLKYPRGDQWHTLRSLSYFEDADNDPTPIVNLGGTTWESVKAKISQATIALL